MRSTKRQLDNNNYNNLDEQDIIHSFLSGDDMAFSIIYNRYVDMLFAYATGMGFEKETIKDAIHDVFYKIYFNKKLLKEVQILKYYLYRMLKNHLLDTYRKSRELEDIQSHEMKFAIKANILDDILAKEEKQALELKIEELFSLLTDRQREAIYLRYMQEMEYEDIAKLLDMTAPAVRKLVARAIKRLRESSCNNYLILLLCSSLLGEIFSINGNI